MSRTKDLAISGFLAIAVVTMFTGLGIPLVAAY